MAQTIELIKALTPLLWPLIIGILLWRLFPAINSIISSRGFSIKIADMQISVQDAAEQFRTQIEDLQKQVMFLRSGVRDHQTRYETPKEAAPVVRTKSRRILWVDDVPTNNALEIAQLQDNGIEVVQAMSTDEAMATLNSHAAFDAIISDMGRRETGGYRSQAGLVLLKAVRKAGYDTPFLVYTTRKYADRNNEEVRSAGGDGATASAVELLEWVSQKTKIE